MSDERIPHFILEDDLIRVLDEDWAPLGDFAAVTSYIPGDDADWDDVPTSVSEALDALAASPGGGGPTGILRLEDAGSTSGSNQSVNLGSADIFTLAGTGITYSAGTPTLVTLAEGIYELKLNLAWTVDGTVTGDQYTPVLDFLGSVNPLGDTGYGVVVFTPDGYSGDAESPGLSYTIYAPAGGTFGFQVLADVPNFFSDWNIKASIVRLGSAVGALTAP